MLPVAPTSISKRKSFALLVEIPETEGVPVVPVAEVALENDESKGLAVLMPLTEKDAIEQEVSVPEEKTTLSQSFVCTALE
jgi:hypothetical protein